MIDLDGGSLLITWPGGNESVRMQGEAVIICTGSWPCRQVTCFLRVRIRSLYSHWCKLHQYLLTAFAG